MTDRKDESLALEEQKVLEGTEKLNEIFSDLLPWTLESTDTALLRENTIQDQEDVKRFLDSLFLFRIGEISVSAAPQDIAELIYKRHQAAIVAAYQSDYTLTTIISGDGGGTVDIFLGVRGGDDVKEVFRGQLQGVYPGKGIKFMEKPDRERVIKNWLREQEQEQKYGGILTGVPIQRIDEEKQTFDLSSVIRSMNGQKFLLMIVSRPVTKDETAQQLHALMALKDQCHALANRTSGFEENKGKNEGHAEQKTEGESSAHGFNLGANIPSPGVTRDWDLPFIRSNTTVAGIPAASSWSAPFFSKTTTGLLMGALGCLGYSYTEANFSSHSETNTKGWSESMGRSLSFEQQNTLAMELENVADKLITRLRNGLNTGLWENFIAYATISPTASQILSGTLSGELIKADPNALPMRNVASQLYEVPLFIPKERDGQSLIKGNKLVSFLSSDEAALLMAPPLSSVPGYDIRVKPALSLTDTIDRSGHPIGYISEHGRVVQGSEFTISEEDARKHIFVSGLTGSGKTTTVKHILHGMDTHFLVIESAKREYRRLLAEEKYDKNLHVYTIGDSGVSPIRHNPFMVLPGISLITHIDNLKSIFYASFSLYGPMPYILEKCIYNIYKERGWNLTTGKHQRVAIETFEDYKQHRYIYPTIRNLIDEVNRYVKKMGYKGELQDNIRSAIVARLESLAVGAKGFLFNTHDAIDLGDLLNKNVVLELESLSDDDDKAFFVGLMLSLVSEYRQNLVRTSSLQDSDELRHVLVIEEAHRLLKNVQTERIHEMLGNPKGKAVESFCNLIAEMRSYGQGVIVAEQIPTKIAPDVIKNTNTKVIHRLVSLDDQIAVGTGLGLEEEECRYLNQLSAGTALAHKEGMSKPVEITVFNKLPNEAIDDTRIKCSDLELKLALHESGLLESKHLQAISLRLVNSLFMSNFELDDLLPEAIATVKKVEQLAYVEDETIEHALYEWFRRTLFSATLGFTNDKLIDGKISDAVDRLWNDRTRFNRGRFIHEFDEWIGECSRKRIKENLSNDAIKECKKTEIDINKIVDNMLILDDVEAKREAMDAIRIRKRVI